MIMINTQGYCYCDKNGNIIVKKYPREFPLNPLDGASMHILIVYLKIKKYCCISFYSRIDQCYTAILKLIILPTVNLAT